MIINKDKKEIYQELYDPNNSEFFKGRYDVPFYIIIGIRGESSEDDLAIPVEKDYIQNNNLRQFIEEYILNKDEDSFLENLKLGNILEIDTNLRQKLKRKFVQLKQLFEDKSILEIYAEPLDLGTEWRVKGQIINIKKVDLDSPLLENLIYIDINSPEESYINIKQYMARFVIQSKENKENLGMVQEQKIIKKGEYSERFGPVLTVFDYIPEKKEIMKIEAVKNRIEDRKKWLPYKEEDLFYLIFAPIRFLRFKHIQNRLIQDYNDGGKTKPSVISDIRENSLMGGVWDYKDIEYLTQIDMLTKNGIIVSTDFNFYGPPYSTLYKAIRDGVLLVGGIEHYFESSKEEDIIKDGIKEKVRKPGQFITYMCMKRMGSEGTQVLIKYQNELGTTGKMITCKEMDMEMATMGPEMKDMDKEMLNKDEKGKPEIKKMEGMR